MEAMSSVARATGRIAASAGGGALVVGAGAAVGFLAASMHAQWSEGAAIEAAAAVPSVEPQPVRPVVVTVIEERHVTPEPVVVYRKVYTTRTVRKPAAAPKPAPAKRRTAPKTASRTVVEPAPSAPRRAAEPAPPARTSRAS